MEGKVENAFPLLALPAVLHTVMARELADPDLRALQLSCRALRNHYQNPQIWEERVRNLPMIPDYVFEHADFRRFTFNYRRLYGRIVAGGRGMAAVLYQGVEPWQLAVLSGEIEQLRKVYGDNYRNFIDAGFKGFSEYLVYADLREELLAWRTHHPEDFVGPKATYKKWPINAVTVGNIPLLQWLVGNFGFDLKAVRVKTQQGERSLLDEAVAQNQRKMFHWLIKQGVPFKA